MKLFSHHKPVSLYRHEFHVYRDWAITIGFFVVTLIAAMVLHVWLFFTVAHDASLDDRQVSSSLHTVNRTELKNAVDILQSRQNLFVDMSKATSTTSVDPSL